MDGLFSYLLELLALVSSVELLALESSVELLALEWSVELLALESSVELSPHARPLSFTTIKKA